MPMNGTSRGADARASSTVSPTYQHFPCGTMERIFMSPSGSGLVRDTSSDADHGIEHVRQEAVQGDMGFPPQSAR